MNVKEFEPVTVVYKEIKTNLINIGQFVGNEPDKLMEQVKKANLEVAAPQVWEYIDMDGNPKKEFTLRICIPVREASKNGLTNIMELGKFKCATMEHKGPWENLKHSYEKLIEDVTKKGYELTNYCREIYHNCDFENADNNITEIQLGIN